MDTVNPRPPFDQPEAGAQPSVKRIRDAALQCFAARGVLATSLREVSVAAGVSIGLVQHHFGTKAGLVEAVDKYAEDVFGSYLAPGKGANPDSVTSVGHQVTALISEHTEVVDYMVRAIVDGTAIGERMFDYLFAVGDARWHRRAEQGMTRSDDDATWVTLNPILLALGALILRSHLDRHLPEPFTTRPQLERWEHSVNSLIRHGHLQSDD